MGMHNRRFFSAYPTSNEVQDKLIRKISKLTEEGLISICLKVKIRICVFRHLTEAKNGRITDGKFLNVNEKEFQAPCRHFYFDIES